MIIGNRQIGWGNIKKYGYIFVPYMTAISMAMIIIFLNFNLYFNARLSRHTDLRYLLGVFMILSLITLTMAFVLVFYSNSFILDERQDEFHLLFILGMEKARMIKILFWENLQVFIIVLPIAILIGSIFNRLNFLLLKKLLHINISTKNLLNIESVVGMVVVFILFLAILQVKNIIYINRLRFEQKHRVKTEKIIGKILGITGIITLTIGYGIILNIRKLGYDVLGYTITTGIIAIIAGTFAIFSYILPKIPDMLKGNKQRYYQRKWFIPLFNISNRIKVNATDLAGICILSCFILLALNITTISAWEISNSRNQYLHHRYMMRHKEIPTRINMTLRDHLEEKQIYQSDRETYGTLIFMGFFTGLSFGIMMMLILYYKQISEGYRDRKKLIELYEIGFTQKEIEKILNSQVKLLFLIPMIATIIHTTFSYRAIGFILNTVFPVNQWSYRIILIFNIAEYIIMYIIAYKITSKKYYQLLQNKPTIL